MSDPRGPEALIERILHAFTSQLEEEYFSCFDARATFLYHYQPERMSVHEYRLLWRTWAESGLGIVACTSTDPFMELFGDLAVFTHSVETVSRLDGAIDVVRERETIVLACTRGQWKAVHQHLSPFADMELK